MGNTQDPTDHFRTTHKHIAESYTDGDRSRLPPVGLTWG